MSLQITKATDLVKGKNISVLVYSAPGVGKTSLARFLPGRTLVIDIDRTTNVLEGSKNVDIVYLNTSKPFIEMKFLLAEVEKNHLENYDNIFIDNLSEFENAWFGEKAKESKTKDGRDLGAPQLQDYNVYNFYFLDMIRYINGWKGVNKIYTAWETQIPIVSSSGQTYNKFYPDVREKLLNGMLGLMNMVGRMVISEKTGTRGILLKPSDDVYAKNQVDEREFATQGDLFGSGNKSTSKSDGKSDAK